MYVFKAISNEVTEKNTVICGSLTLSRHSLELKNRPLIIRYHLTCINRSVLVISIVIVTCGREKQVQSKTSTSVKGTQPNLVHDTVLTAQLLLG